MGLPSILRPALSLFLGAATVFGLGWCVARVDASDARSSRGVHLWVADRGAGRIVGLDREGLETESVPLVAPVALVGASDGGVWVVDAVEARPTGDHRLLRVGVTGGVSNAGELGPVVDLASVPPGCLVLFRGGNDPSALRLACFGGEGRRWERGVGGVSCLGASGRWFVVGDRDGRVSLHHLERPDVLRAECRLGPPIVDLAAGPGGGWWALSGPRGRLVRLDSGLRVVWDQETGLEGPLVALGDREAVWVLEGGGREARRYGDRGHLELREDLPLPGLGGGVGIRGGGLGAWIPGAILMLDGRGRLVETQGGFDHAVGLALDVRRAD